MQYGFIKQNRQVVISSALVARAAVQRADGRVEHIVVFQKSTKLEFYWVFASKSENSPRRAWRYATHFRRDHSFQPKPYDDFGSFVEYYARIKAAKVLYVRMHQPRRLAALLQQTQRETINQDWDAVTDPNGSTELVQKRAAYARKKHSYFFNERNRELDNLPIQSNDEVLVFEDECEECGKRHSFAHFPNGLKKCKVGFDGMKSNPGFEYRGFQNKSFRFTYRTF